MFWVDEHSLNQGMSQIQTRFLPTPKLHPSWRRTTSGNLHSSVTVPHLILFPSGHYHLPDKPFNSSPIKWGKNSTSPL